MNLPQFFSKSPNILARVIIPGLSAIALLSTRADCSILLSDDFDSYVDQAAFVASWPQVAGTSASGTLSTTQFVSSPKAINFGTTTQRNERSFTESGLPTSPDLNNVIRFSIDFFDANAAINPYRQSASLQDGTAPSGSGQLISLGLNNNLLSSDQGGNFYMARILSFNGGAFFKLNDNSSLLRSTGWHNLAVEISDIDFKFYVDGQLAETVSQSGLTLRSYDVVRIGSGLTSTSETYLDNVKVETIPEPSSALLVSMGCLLLNWRRRTEKPLSPPLGCLRKTSSQLRRSHG